MRDEIREIDDATQAVDVSEETFSATLSESGIKAIQGDSTENEQPSEPAWPEVGENTAQPDATSSSQEVGGVKDQEDSASGKDWVDLGIQDIPVEQVDLSDSPVNGAEDFKKVSREDMVEGYKKLETEIRPAVERGANGDDFSQLDQDRGLDYEHGNRRVYDAFYGDTSIKVDKVGDSYSVVNGYHRLAVAKELGLPTVPARVHSHR